MKQTIIYMMLSFCFFSCAMDPCGDADSFVEKHETFVDATIEKIKDFDDEQWEAEDLKREEMMDGCYDKLKEKMTKSQKRKIMKNNTRFAMARVEQNMDDIDLSELGEHLSEVFDEDFQEQVGDIVLEVSDEFKEIFDEDFQDKMKEIFDEDLKGDLKDALDDMGEGLKEMADALKEAVDKIEIKEE